MTDNRAVHIIDLLQRQLNLSRDILATLIDIKSDTALILVGVNQIAGNTAAAVTALNNIIALINVSNTNLANIVTILNTITTELQVVRTNLDTLVAQGTVTYNQLLVLIDKVEALKVSQEAFYASILKFEDTPSVSGDAGVQILTQRQDALSITTSNNGDYQPLKTDATGALYVTGAAGGGGGDATAANQVVQIAQARSKINRIKGAANFAQVITYVGATTDVNTITYTGTTDLGAETIVMTLTYDGSNRITNVVYT